MTFRIFDNDFLWGLSSVDVSENHQMIRATGGILSFIKENSSYFGNDVENQFFDCIKKIVQIPLYEYDFIFLTIFLKSEGFLQLDLNTIQSLSIFKRNLTF